MSREPLQLQRLQLLGMPRLLASFLLACSLTCDSFLRTYEQNQYSVGDTSSVISHVFKETIPLLLSRDDIEKRDRVPQDHVHNVVFVVQQRNMDELTRILHDVSDPASANYGQHMTKEEVSEMTSNPEARDAVLKYINANGATFVSETLSSEYITASAPISVWERVFNTEFYTFHKIRQDGRREMLVRAERYWLPNELDQHVDSVFNTIQMPFQSFGALPTKMKNPMHTTAYDLSAKITPQKLMAYYGVGESKGSASSTQAVFATIKQYFSPNDLKYFFKTMGLPEETVASSTGNHTSDIICIRDSSSCSEANLDVQYIMAASPGSPTSYMYTDETFSTWLMTVANMTSPPLVISISYGAEEAGVQYSDMNAFNTEAIKMGVIGITIVVASGDDGALTRKVREVGVSACAYSPFFPASSPYVVSVGATSVSDYHLKTN